MSISMNSNFLLGGQEGSRPYSKRLGGVGTLETAAPPPFFASFVGKGIRRRKESTKLATKKKSPGNARKGKKTCGQ
jgi:hypothetical protein